MLALVSHVEYADETDRQTDERKDGRQIVTLRFPLDAASWRVFEWYEASRGASATAGPLVRCTITLLPSVLPWQKNVFRLPRPIPATGNASRWDRVLVAGQGQRRRRRRPRKSSWQTDATSDGQTTVRGPINPVRPRPGATGVPRAIGVHPDRQQRLRPKPAGSAPDAFGPVIWRHQSLASPRRRYRYVRSTT